MIGALDSMHRHAIRAQDPLDLGEHGVLLFRGNVTEHIQAHDVIERAVGKRQRVQIGAHTFVVTIPASRRYAFIGKINARQVDPFAF